jgi:hypothetical protein
MITIYHILLSQVESASSGKNHTYVETDPEHRASVVERAKAYAREQSTSVSALVEKMLDVAATAWLRERPRARGPEPTSWLAQAWHGRRLPPLSREEASVKRLLLDVNVILDVVLDRNPSPMRPRPCGRPWSAATPKAACRHPQ